MSTSESKIIAFLLERPDEAYFALEISQATGLSTRRLYPALARLEREDMVKSDWQEMAEPRRRAYWATERVRTLQTV